MTWFGGKLKIAPLVWERFGDVPNYVEPLAGSLAVLLARPHPPRTETVNDMDGMVSNFWRAVAADPDAVARWADWPVNECDLHARHLWLVNVGRPHVEKLKTDPDYYDAKIAGWWVWGLCQWIGSGWCEHAEWKQLPHLGRSMGVHRSSLQLPHLGAGLNDYFRAIGDRLRRVRVCCGNWDRVCGPSPTVKQGTTAVFLDPPYDQGERNPNIYAVETPVAADVRAWCAENGADTRLRIALCGYAGEGHESLERLGWDVVEWKAVGGYGNQADGAGRDNARRERIWFSPGCLRSDADDLFF